MQEIYQTEKAFEKMASDSGIAIAFYHFADENAVIKRQNDTLIIGKENIRKHYDKPVYMDATVSWEPDFADVSECGTLGYTYGHYLREIRNTVGEINEYKGVFHTVWKRQEVKTWKYVWD